MLVETSDGRRRTMCVANTVAEIERLVTYLATVKQLGIIAFEPTGVYDRALMQAVSTTLQPSVVLPGDQATKVAS